MSFTASKVAIAVAGTVLLFGASQDASAVTAQRKFLQLASGVCDVVLPAEDTKVRRTYTGLQNVSSLPVNIGCSILGDEYAATDITQVFMYFKNNSAVTADVRCVLADGNQFIGFTYTPQVISFSPGQYTFFSWDPATHFANLNCTVPPGFTAHEIGVRWSEDVGS